MSLPGRRRQRPGQTQEVGRATAATGIEKSLSALGVDAASRDNEGDPSDAENPEDDCSQRAGPVHGPQDPWQEQCSNASPYSDVGSLFVFRHIASFPASPSQCRCDPNRLYPRAIAGTRPPLRLLAARRSERICRRSGSRQRSPMLCMGPGARRLR